MINLCSRKWPICILVEPGILILISVALYGKPGFHHGRFAKYLVILIRTCDPFYSHIAGGLYAV